MYPFYERGVHCYADVREYLSTWLSPENIGHNEPIVHDGKPHQLVASFRRAFVSHLALFEPTSGNYIFVIIPDGSLDTNKTYAISGYQDTYEGMIDDAATCYCKLWKIA